MYACVVGIACTYVSLCGCVWLCCIDYCHPVLTLLTQDIPCSMVEQEYWTVVSELDSGVVVEYGADLHCSTHGSGFPRINTARTEEEKVTSSTAAAA